MMKKKLMVRWCSGVMEENKFTIITDDSQEEVAIKYKGSLYLKESTIEQLLNNCIIGLQEYGAGEKIDFSVSVLVLEMLRNYICNRNDTVFKSAQIGLMQELTKRINPK